MKNKSSIFYYNYSTCSAIEELSKRLSKHKTRLPLWRDYLDLVCVYISRFCECVIAIGCFLSACLSITVIRSQVCPSTAVPVSDIVPPPPYFR